MPTPHPIRPRSTLSKREPLRSIWNRSFQVFQFGFALIGLGLAMTLVLLATQSDVRESAGQRLVGWLQQRQALGGAAGVAMPASWQAPPTLVTTFAAVAIAPAGGRIVALTAPTEPPVAGPAAAESVARVGELADARAIAEESVLGADPKTLPRAQAKVASWLSEKYRVAPEPLSVLVAEAWDIGQRQSIDWTLILAVMAVESSFNPFAQSSMGAQGLMQVMTGIHQEKYEQAGGKLAAFDPVTNLRVGAQVLLECIARAGSTEAGLKYYVGAANAASDNGYAKRVLAERARIKKVAAGRAVS